MNENPWHDVFQLLIDLDDAGVTDIMRGNGDDRLYVRPASRITAELAGRITALKPALLEAVTPLPLDADGWPVDSVAPGEPCGRCGSLAKWWDSWGDVHCQSCERETLTQAHALAERAAAIRAGRGCPADPRPGRLGR